MVVILVSCDANTNPAAITVTSTIQESLQLAIPQTNGTPVAAGKTITKSLADVVSNFPNVKSIKINSLEYSFKNATGNPSAVIQSGTLSVNGVNIVMLTNFNITDAATSGTATSISDATIINQLGALFLSSSSMVVEFSGTALSDGGAISFQAEVKANITATF